MTETRWTLDAIAAPETMGRPEGQVKPQEVQSRGRQDAKARGEARRRRTWKRALWIAGLALVVVASTAAWNSGSPFAGTNSFNRVMCSGLRTCPSFT